MAVMMMMGLMGAPASLGGLHSRRHPINPCPSQHRPRHHTATAPTHAQQPGAQGWTGVVKLGSPKVKKGSKKQQQKDAAAVEQGTASSPPPQDTPSLPAPDPMWRLSVVQVLATHQLPHPLKPWSQTADLQSSSSAVVVNAAQRLCITTAGAVHYAAWSQERDASLVQVYIPSHGCTVTAQVLVVAQDADLALIQLDTLPRSAIQSPLTASAPVDTPSTATTATTTTTITAHHHQPPAGLHAVSWSRGTPELGAPVHVAGFAVAQSNDTSAGSVCVTKGVTSRLEVITYAYSGRRLLGLQVDAAVNAGCWGGGVFNSSGHFMGLLLQRSPAQTWKSTYCPSSHKSDRHKEETAENVAYVVPVCVISHFLTDVKQHRGRYQGFPCLGFMWQPLASAALRRHCAVPDDVQGVRVTGCDPQQSCWHVLQPGDVVTHVGGHAVSDAGHVYMLPHQQHGQKGDDGPCDLLTVCMSHVAASEHVGTELQVQILRQGVPMTFEIRLSAPKPLVPIHASITHDDTGTGAAAPRAQHQDPAYVFLPPLAFVAATVPLMQQLYRSRAHMPQEPGKQRLGHRPPRAHTSEAPAHTSRRLPPPADIVDNTDESGHSLAIASSQGRVMAYSKQSRPAVPTAAGGPAGSVDTAPGPATGKPCLKALQGAVYGLQAVDLAGAGVVATDIQELVLLVGSCPAWAKKRPTAGDPRDDQTDDGLLLKDLQLPLWLITFDTLAVRSVAHLQELVEMHEGGLVRLGFACGSVLYVHLDST